MQWLRLHTSTHFQLQSPVRELIPHAAQCSQERKIKYKNAHTHNAYIHIYVYNWNNNSYRGCGEKGTLLHCQWACRLVLPLWWTVWQFLKERKLVLPYDTVMLLLAIFLGKTLIPKDTCTPMFIAALFTIDKTCKFFKILPKARKKTNKQKNENILKQTASEQGLKLLGILKSRGLMISKQSKSQVSNPSSMLAF